MTRKAKAAEIAHEIIERLVGECEVEYFYVSYADNGEAILTVGGPEAMQIKFKLIPTCNGKKMSIDLQRMSGWFECKGIEFPVKQTGYGWTDYSMKNIDEVANCISKIITSTVKELHNTAAAAVNIIKYIKKIETACPGAASTLEVFLQSYNDSDSSNIEINWNDIFKKL